MADVDEDIIPRSGAPAEEADLTDETQDFRFLTSISREDAAIPKRGEKDFEPYATALQSNTLAASRQAMHNALSFQRVHPPKGYTRATYHPETNMAYADNPKGVHFAKMGFAMSAKDDPIGDDGLRGQRLWLLSEEVIYLLERGSLDVRWPACEGDDDGVGLPMSLQGAYAMLIGDGESQAGALTFERYSVYAGLKRMGYTVMRAPSWDVAGPLVGKECFAPLPQRTWQAGLSSIAVWWSTLSLSTPEDISVRQEKGPLVRLRLYRSYADIFHQLALINYHDPTSRTQPSDPLRPSTDQPFQTTYHVWKPGSQTFKKSAPGPPDFRIAVINARETAIPTVERLDRLLETLPYDPPLATAQMYQRLKHGYKNVVLAIVDQGVVSYLRVADAAFGCEKLYEHKGRGPRGKRGGRGGKGGRGKGG